ncbi:hypothetical protein ERX37_09345 [Macrococcus hajekii]|uniref:GrpB family protein n=1 Tax=Macrococcus hajekii TaxID=198482 RepID=A0A4R6BI67_9STAP|nr:GrpB family protein [Macrococcus hajekii]TDM01309.1 hypothetical protein ERX37_09345 [Macrococcus hajekii]GGB10575.1 hypothetical protein GCM10007190_18250 [Macrococcus hajekii]
MIDKMPYSFQQYRTLFIEESKRLIEILGNDITELHHYGSSAVAGLPFNNEINILPVVKSLDCLDIHLEALEAQGYEMIERTSDYRLCQKEEYNRLIRVKWVEQSNMNEVQNTLLLRNYLRDNAEAKQRFAHFQLQNKQQARNEMDYQLNELEYMTSLIKEAIEWQKRF